MRKIEDLEFGAEDDWKDLWDDFSEKENTAIHNKFDPESLCSEDTLLRQYMDALKAVARARLDLESANDDLNEVEEDLRQLAEDEAKSGRWDIYT